MSSFTSLQNPNSLARWSGVMSYGCTLVAALFMQVSGLTWIFAHILARASTLQEENASLTVENHKLASENAQFI